MLIYLNVHVFVLGFVVQHGLKAIEYHGDGSSAVSQELFHAVQVPEEGGTRTVYVPVQGMLNLMHAM